jgi:hypothetical protein
LTGSGEEERKGKAAGRGGICGGARPGEAEGEEERKGTGERLTGGAGSSVKQKKRKRAGERGLPRGEAWWAAGPEGGEGKYFSFLFQTLFETTFKLNFK